MCASARWISWIAGTYPPDQVQHNVYTVWRERWSLIGTLPVQLERLCIGDWNLAVCVSPGHAPKTGGTFLHVDGTLVLHT